ncbi:hypothetical protein V6N13_043042 [Hibiscus sabdariffa]
MIIDPTCSFFLVCTLLPVNITSATLQAGLTMLTSVTLSVTHGIQPFQSHKLLCSSLPLLNLGMNLCLVLLERRKFNYGGAFMEAKVSDEEWCMDHELLKFEAVTFFSNLFVVTNAPSVSYGIRGHFPPIVSAYGETLDVVPSRMRFV